MKNRYTGNLRDNDRTIHELAPAALTSRIIAAYEVKKVIHEGSRVLDLGCGGGNSAKPVLEMTDIDMDLLDVSQEMIDEAREYLSEFSDRTNYICQDALEYLRSSEPYDVILSEWTIHNFSWSEKRELFEAIYGALHDGGTFILMDKVYPENGGEEMLEKQLKRYTYLDPEVARGITEHERQDYLPEHRMDEPALIDVLREVGFKNITLADRVERDVVLVASK
ncbi:MAG: class I SAM-dependent methyltransferase [Patescibacteria group bacterium]|jgi:ubiquinone/menaquinone biosynthesis C-methylase UbiE